MRRSAEDRANAVQDDERFVELVNGAAVIPEPLKWLWPGWLAAGKFHMIAGHPGTGKTCVALSMAATITTGGRWPDGTRADQGRVIIWSGEDTRKDVLVPRLIAAGADLSRCEFIGDAFQAGERRPFDPATDIKLLKLAIAAAGDVRLVVIDSVVSAVGGDSHKNAETRRGLAPLVELAESLGCAVLGITHFSKGTAGRDPLERVSGSLAFGALARVVFVAFKTAEDEVADRCFVRVKSNIGPDTGGFIYRTEEIGLANYPEIRAQRVAWGAALAGTAKEMLARAEAIVDPEERTALNEACDFLRALLADGPVSSRRVRAECDGAGHAWATVRRAQRELGVIVSKEGGRFGNTKQRWTWRLPDTRCSPAYEQENVSTFCTDEHLQEDAHYNKPMNTFSEDVHTPSEDVQGAHESVFGIDEHLRDHDQPQGDWEDF